MVEGTALPSKIYYRETGETRMWDYYGNKSNGCTWL